MGFMTIWNHRLGEYLPYDIGGAIGWSPGMRGIFRSSVRCYLESQTPQKSDILELFPTTFEANLTQMLHVWYTKYIPAFEEIP